jgi:hypothetical protein
MTRVAALTLALRRSSPLLAEPAAVKPEAMQDP